MQKPKLYGIFFIAVTTVMAASYSSASWLDKLSEIVGGQGDSNTTEVPSSPSVSGLSTADINDAFKQALELGSQKVVAQLGKKEGFNQDSAIHIPLPAQLQSVRTWLDKVGLAASVDDLEVKLNRAAEHAVPKTRELFVETIKTMSFDDVRSIYQGNEDAATRYFQDKMTPALSQAMQPVVEDSLSDVGAVQLYDKVMSDYQSVPFVPDVKADLVNHVVDGGLNGIFHYLAQEEAEIRKNPLKRSTQLLKKVFGAQ